LGKAVWKEIHKLKHNILETWEEVFSKISTFIVIVILTLWQIHSTKYEKRPD
jgi:hypothetical protein